jgi:MFS family permease
VNPKLAPKRITEQASNWTLLVTRFATYGRHGDRHGHARLLVPGLIATSFGMIAMIWLATPATVIAGMCLFGAGFGIVQNATLALMIDRMPASGLGRASALWNLAYDAGTGRVPRSSACSSRAPGTRPPSP